MNNKRVFVFFGLMVIFSVIRVSAIIIDPTLVLRMDFDNNADDISGNNNNALIHEAILAFDGRFGNSFRFDGINDYISIKDENLSDDFPGKDKFITEDFSFSFWVKPESLKKSVLFSKEDVNGKSFSIELSENGFLIVRIYGNGESVLIGDSILKIGEWNHIVFVYDFVANGNSVMSLYVNGALNGADSVRTNAIGPISDTSGEFRIGTSFANANFFNGFIDELIIFKRVLSEQEIQSLHDKNELGEAVEGRKCSSGYYFLEGYGCKPFASCTPSFVCSPISACANGIRELKCEDIKCGLSTKVEIAECNLDICISNYNCTEWSSCFNGNVERKCIDLNNCGREEDKPEEIAACGAGISLAPDEFCTPNINCGEFSECQYFDEVRGIFEGDVRVYGVKERSCTDLNNCINNFVEKIPCESLIKLEFVSEEIIPTFSPQDEFTEECKNNVLTLYLDNKPVSHIDIDSWIEDRKFNTQFVQDKGAYCSYCYNAIKDGDEEGIDCGGSCKDCIVEKNFSMKEFIMPLWIVIGVLFAVLYYRLGNGAYIWGRLSIRKRVPTNSETTAVMRKFPK